HCTRALASGGWKTGLNCKVSMMSMAVLGQRVENPVAATLAVTVTSRSTLLPSVALQVTLTGPPALVSSVIFWPSTVMSAMEGSSSFHSTSWAAWDGSTLAVIVTDSPTLTTRPGSALIPSDLAPKPPKVNVTSSNTLASA